MLDRLSSYFSLFRLEVCVRGRMVSVLCFSPAAEDGRASSIPVEPWSRRALIPSALIRLNVQCTQIKTLLSALLVFKRFLSTQTAQV